MIIHVLDGSSDDPVADYNQIKAELALFDDRLVDRPEMVVINKLDLPDVREYLPLLEEQLAERGLADTLAISALTRENITRLIQLVFEMAPESPNLFLHPISESPVYELEDSDVSFEINREDGVFYISGAGIERAAAMTYWDYEEAVARFQKTLEALGIAEALEEAGIQDGDTVFVGEYELEWSE